MVERKKHEVTPEKITVYIHRKNFMRKKDANTINFNNNIKQKSIKL